MVGFLLWLGVRWSPWVDEVKEMLVFPFHSISKRREEMFCNLAYMRGIKFNLILMRSFE